MKIWLIKTDPESYSWEQFKKDRSTVWDGVRNYQARNYLKEMGYGDLILFYQSGSIKEITGTAFVSREHFPDPSTDDERWVAMEIQYINEFSKPVSLEAIKNEKKLADFVLLKQSRLSVIPVSIDEFKLLLNFV